MKKFIKGGFMLLCLVLFLVLLAGCSALEQKAVAGAGAIDALKIETAGGSTTGTLLPNITMGGAVSAIATSPSMDNGKTAAPVISFAKRTSWLGELFGISADTSAFSYIGVPGETAADTGNRLTAAAKFFNDTAAKDDKDDDEEGSSEAGTASVAAPGEVSP